MQLLTLSVSTKVNSSVTEEQAKRNVWADEHWSRWTLKQMNTEADEHWSSAETSNYILQKGTYPNPADELTAEAVRRLEASFCHAVVDGSIQDRDTSLSEVKENFKCCSILGSELWRFGGTSVSSMWRGGWCSWSTGCRDRESSWSIN